MPVQLPQIVRGAGEQPFAFAHGETAPGHRGRFLAGLELPEHRFHGARPQLVVFPPAGMPQAPDGTGGGRILVQVPGSLGGTPARPVRVLGQRREQSQLVLVGAGKVVLADVPGVGQHGASSGRIPAWFSCSRQVSSKGCSRARSTGCRDSIAPTITCCAVTTAWPLYPAT